MLAVLAACGTTDPIESDSVARERPRQDGGSASERDAGTRDGSTGKPDDEPSTSDPGLDGESCGELRTEAERGPGTANIVWVIDSSGSMNEEATLVRENLQRFVDATLSAGLSDYRVVMMTDPDFVSAPEPLASDSEHFLFVDENVGSDEPLSDLLERHADYAPFLLPDVLTHFVVVTDDESEIDAAEFIERMTAEHQGDFRVHAVASPPVMDNGQQSSDNPLDWIIGQIGNRGCKGVHGDAAAPGIQNYQAAAMTGGLTFSICNEDWSGLFSELAQVVGKAALPCSLKLPEMQTSGSMYDPEQVSVVFTPTDGKAVDLPRVTSEADCEQSGGWYYDDPDSPKQVQLCPTSCASSTTGGKLDIEFGCIYVVQ